MRALKKNNMLDISSIRKAGLLLILLFLSSTSIAKIIDIKSTHTYIENNAYFIDSVFDFKLTDEANKALLHGIPLQIQTRFQLRLKRKWLWDKTISEKVIISRLEYLPLTNNFLTVIINSGLSSSYSNLEAALNHINTIMKVKLFDIGLLSEEKNYAARVKISLDKHSLPTPLQPQAYFSSKWDISSKWYEWKIDQ